MGADPMREEKLCGICGQPIPATRKSHNTKYCSEKCSRAAEAKQRTSYISKKANHINAVSQLVYKAYDRKCAICGWQATPDLIKVNGKYQYSHGNEIHHITPASEGGKEEDTNLILLCPNHHKQADLQILDRSYLQAHTRRFTMTTEEKHEARVKCAEAIAYSIFGE